MRIPGFLITRIFSSNFSILILDSIFTVPIFSFEKRQNETGLLYQGRTGAIGYSHR